jgi:hypothetical protein
MPLINLADRSRVALSHFLDLAEPPSVAGCQADARKIIPVVPGPAGEASLQQVKTLVTNRPEYSLTATPGVLVRTDHGDKPLERIDPKHDRVYICLGDRLLKCLAVRVKDAGTTSVRNLIPLPPAVYLFVGGIMIKPTP